jgi:hypothetical protein
MPEPRPDHVFRPRHRRREAVLLAPARGLPDHSEAVAERSQAQQRLLDSHASDLPLRSFEADARVGMAEAGEPLVERVEIDAPDGALEARVGLRQAEDRPDLRQ